jgi:hypothetical protein
LHIIGSPHTLKSNRMCILDPSPPAIKQRQGTYFDYNRAAIGLAVRRRFNKHTRTHTQSLTQTHTNTIITGFYS